MFFNVIDTTFSISNGSFCNQKRPQPFLHSSLRSFSFPRWHLATRN